MDAPAGKTNIKFWQVGQPNGNVVISAGDKIVLDIDSVGHGIDTVTVTKVGTQSTRGLLSADANAGAISVNIQVRGRGSFTTGDKMTIGTPATQEAVTITAVGALDPGGFSVTFTPALAKVHPSREAVMDHGTGLDLAAPLKFNHAANLPFGNRGTGISFQPATAFAHSSNEPIQALGTGILLDSPLRMDHEIDAVVRDASVANPGYQGMPAPNQWFGGPACHPLRARWCYVLGRPRCRQPQLRASRRSMGRRGLPGRLRIGAEWLPGGFARECWTRRTGWSHG